MFAGDGDTRNPPVEVIENRYPLRVERHALVPELGGAGRLRGGPGVARDFRMLEPGISMQFTVENVGDTLAKGLRGGGDGRPGYLVLAPGPTTRRSSANAWRCTGRSHRATSSVPGPAGAAAGAIRSSANRSAWPRTCAAATSRPGTRASVYGVVLIDDGEVRADPVATAEPRGARR